MFREVKTVVFINFSTAFDGKSSYLGLMQKIPRIGITGAVQESIRNFLRG